MAMIEISQDPSICMAVYVCTNEEELAQRVGLLQDPAGQAERQERMAKAAYDSAGDFNASSSFHDWNGGKHSHGNLAEYRFGFGVCDIRFAERENGHIVKSFKVAEAERWMVTLAEAIAKKINDAAEGE